ncbi:MAG TPA: hypothetical protein EYH03_06300 [Chromatiales bacterium]|nr:hypothetical protein [Chromatiales bacterium]
MNLSLKILLIRSSLLLALLLTPLCAVGEIQDATEASVPRTELQDTSGLTITLPQVDDQHVTALLQRHQELLELRIEQLKQARAQARFTTKDAVITAVLPGGLLYAAYRTRQATRLNAQLARIHRQLKEVSVDLLAFEQPALPQRIAALH